MRLVYLVHNLNDPAVARRIASLNEAGFKVLVSGFWREHEPAAEICGAKVLSLGRTHDAALVHRAAVALRRTVFPAELCAEIAAADLVMARNLEMLAIAASARQRAAGTAALIYEVLDIHRLMLGDSVLARSLRGLERVLLRRVALVIVSSPAFHREYFAGVQKLEPGLPIEVIENKTFVKQDAPTVAAPKAARPWRIAWLGIIRCRKSLGILARLAARRPDLLQVHVYGRLTKELRHDIERLDRVGVQLWGPYAPQELPRLYAGAHFNWAIDYFEEGGNSNWLLPNRIYEGGLHDAVTLAIEGTETARWLRSNGLGVILHDPEAELETFFENLTRERYLALKAQARLAPRSLFLAGDEDRDRLRALLLAAAGHGAVSRPESRVAPAIPLPEAGR